MKKIIFTFASLLILGNPYGYCQGVGVNILGALPDVSALLDIDATGSTPKGILIPRISLTSATDIITIATPANSLLVYNIGTGGLAPAGYYYNQGSIVAANWLPLVTDNVNTAAAWSLTGNAGTTTSTTAIGSPVDNHFIGTTDAKDFVFASNNLERMRISSTGNIGIGTKTPAATFDVVGTVEMFGARQARAENTVYGPAASDGFFCFFGRYDGVSGALATVYIYTGASNPPATLVATGEAYNLWPDWLGNFQLTVPIRKGDYYKAVYSMPSGGYLGIPIIYFIPLGH